MAKSCVEQKVCSIYNFDRTQPPTAAKDSTLSYGESVLLSCFEAQNWNKKVLDGVRNARQVLNDYKPKNFSSVCLELNLSFFYGVEKRKQIVKQRRAIRATTLADYSTNLTGRVNRQYRKSFLHEKQFEGEDERWTNQILQIHEGFTVAEDEYFASYTSTILDEWDRCIKINKGIGRDSIAYATLRTIIVCGEYLHLYKFRDIEAKAWKLAFELAEALEQATTCVYVVSRCLGIRCHNDEWIATAEKYIKNNEQLENTEVLAYFWLEMADFYFDCKQIEKGKKLLAKVKKLSCYNYPIDTKDPVIRAFASDIEFRNYFVIHKQASQEDYVDLLVKIHYTLTDFHDFVHEDDGRKYDEVEYKLFGYSKMFDVLCNVVIPTLSLHSYHEILVHINEWFQLAQKHGWTMRIAECLKYLCYLDLLLLRVKSCEKKLDQLERILCVDEYKEIALEDEDEKKQNKKKKKKQAKPELERKLLRLPNFLYPDKSPCECWRCNNANYKYLLFACTYIRAQLYCLVDFEAESKQHFYAAFKLKQHLDESECLKISRNFIVDYLMWIIDFAIFIKKFVADMRDDALLLFEEAVNVASENHLGMHPISAFAQEMICEHFFDSLPQDKLLSAVFVPHAEDPKGSDDQIVDTGPVTRSKSTKLIVEVQNQGPMTRSRVAKLSLIKN